MTAVRSSGPNRARLALALAFVGLAIALPSSPTATDASLRWTVDGTQVSASQRVFTRLDGGHQLELSFSAPSKSLWVSADLEMSGHAALLRGSGRLSDVAQSRESPRCHERANGTVECHLPLSTAQGDDRLTIIPADSRPISVVATVRYLRASPRREFPHLSAAMLVLILALPIVVFLHGRSIAASQWTILTASCAALVLLQPLFVVSLLAWLAMLFRMSRSPDARIRRAGVWAGVLGSVVFLIAWKYGSALGAGVFAVTIGPSWAMPLGVSYFCIRVIDTQLRWRRGELLDASFREYSCHVLFPATVPAGPIETLDGFRAGRLARLDGPELTKGATRALLGLTKKLLIADSLLLPLLFGPSGLYLDNALDPARARPASVVAMAVLSLLFAYVDFSAYSDIAIGCGRMFGYRIRENFSWPLLADSLREFWRRWHISLSQWCFRNISFPLAIATRSEFLPLLATMLVVGLWHELDRSWYAWALHHASGLWITTRVAKRWRGIQDGQVARVARVILVVIFVAAGHTFVLVSDFGTALRLYSRFWGIAIP